MIKSPYLNNITNKLSSDIAIIKLTEELIKTYTKFLSQFDEIKQTIDKRVGPKGDKGKDGYTPVKGKDYFTLSEIREMISFILKQATPKKGVDYFDGISPEIDYEHIINATISKLPVIKDGKDGLTPIKGIDYLTKEEIESVKQEIKSDLGNLIKQTDPEELLHLFTQKGKKLSIKHIDGLEQTISAFSNQLGRGYLHGGGVPSLTAGAGITLTSKSDGGYTVSTSASGSVITMTGTIDDSNVTFTCSTQPSEMVINGVSYLTTGGAITWTYLAGTITLSVPVGTNGTIWGRK